MHSSELIKAGLKRARAAGKQIGRQRTRPTELIHYCRSQGYSLREIGRMLKISASTVHLDLKERETLLEQAKITSQPLESITPEKAKIAQD